MKNRYRVLSLILIFILTAYVFSPVIDVFCYYFSKTEAIVAINTGGIQLSIDRLTVDGIQADEDDQISGILGVNRGLILTFLLINTGTCALDYFLDIQVAWDEQDLGDDGRLFIYPATTSDNDILQSLIQGDYSGAIAYEQDIIEGELKGIYKTLDHDFLQTLGQKSSKEYALKLFFYADSASALTVFENKSLQIGLWAQANLQGRTEGWHSLAQRFISLISLIDQIAPVINQVPLPKVFYITQTGAIDLQLYATAFDQEDGDITSNITIACDQIDGAGEYTVTYNVRNSRGIAAVPLKITIIVWDFVKTESGNAHTLALTTHGRVYSWGTNSHGQLGDGTNIFKSTPTLIALQDVIDIAAGDLCSFALTADGQIYSWGTNAYGQLGVGEGINQVNIPTPIAQPAEAVFAQISCRVASVGAVTDDGDVYTWGLGERGELGNGRTDNSYLPTKIELSGIKTVSMGQDFGTAITYDGVLYTWGRNSSGQLGHGLPNSGIPVSPAPVMYFVDAGIKIMSVSAGYVHVAAIGDNNQLYTWGSGDEGRLGDGSATRKNIPQPIQMPARPIKAVAGYADTGVITQDGLVYFFGYNYNGKHGLGDTNDRWTPTLNTGIQNAVSLSLAVRASFVLTAQSNVYSMGHGNSGMLGTGNTNDSLVPVIWAFTPPPPY